MRISSWSAGVLGGAALLGLFGCRSEFTFGADPAPIPGAAPIGVGSAGDLCVDDDNTTGIEDGTPAHPFRSVGGALRAAAASRTPGRPAVGVLKVAQGDYRENLRLEDTALVVRGGYEGGTRAGYASGSPASWEKRDPKLFVSRLVGTGDGATVVILDGHNTTFEGLTVTGGTGEFDGDRYEGGGFLIDGGSFKLLELVIERNDIRHDRVMARGGGVSIQSSEGVIERCVLRDNAAMRGAAVAAGRVGHVILRDNVIERNVSIDDHGGGLFLQGELFLLERNLVKDNAIGRTEGGTTWGWGGGIYLHSKGTVARLADNIITGNRAPTLGSGLFVDNEATVYSSRDLFYGNACNLGGVAIYVDGLDDSGTTGSRAWIDGATIAEHRCQTRFGGNAVLAQGDSVVSVVNSVVWNNGTRALSDGKAITDEWLSDFATDASSSRIDVDWTLSQSPVVWRELEGGAWTETFLTGHGNLFTDPLFADPAHGDFHLQSAHGRWQSMGPTSGRWVRDVPTSPAIDRADPGAPPGAEPLGTELRRDLGAFGGTREASLSRTPVSARRSIPLVAALLALSASVACDYGQPVAADAALPARVNAATASIEDDEVLIDEDAGTRHAVSGAGVEAARSADGPCETYCADVQRACTDTNRQYPSFATCLAVCRAQPAGTSCRADAARRALARPDRATCAAAGMTGGDVCGNRCDVFCKLAARACGTGASAPFRDEATCRAACGPSREFAFDATRSELAKDPSRNDLNCRLAMLTDALSEGLAASARACPRLAPKGARGATCVD